MAKQSDKKTEERWDIVEESTMAKKKALKALEIAKKIEKSRSETHYWHISVDGKTRTQKRINN
jgi:hypothetical protein